MQNKKVASRLKRFIGYSIDIVIIFFILSVIGGITSIILVLLYRPVCETKFQKTLGKLITKTKVVDKDGDIPELSKIIWRTVLRNIPYTYFSFISNQYPIGWHDKHSETFVVPSEYTISDVLEISEIERKQYKLSDPDEIEILKFLQENFSKESLNKPNFNEIIIEQIKLRNYLKQEWQIHYAKDRIRKAFIRL